MRPELDGYEPDVEEQDNEEREDCGCSSYFCPCSGTKRHSSEWL